MARIRSIHPNACTSEKLAHVSGDAERCYWRLQTHCDDEGRCEDNVRLIWAALFPLHEEIGPTDVDVWLDELEAEGLIVRYVVSEKRYLYVTLWGDFQHPQRPKPSLIPAPSEPCTRQVRDDSATGTALVLPGEGEGEGTGEGVGVGVAPRSARARDPLWDAIVECWHIDAFELTETERGKLNKAVSQLRAIDAAPDDVPRRRAAYRVKYRDVADTPLAVVAHWAELKSTDDGGGPRVAKAHGAIARAAGRL